MSDSVSALLSLNSASATSTRTTASNPYSSHSHSQSSHFVENSSDSNSSDPPNSPHFLIDQTVITLNQNPSSNLPNNRRQVECEKATRNNEQNSVARSKLTIDSSRKFFGPSCDSLATEKMETEQSETTTSTTSDAAVESTVGPSTKVPASDEEQPEQTNSNSNSNPPTPTQHPRGRKRTREDDGDGDDDETQEGVDDDEDASSQSQSGDLATSGSKSKEISQLEELVSEKSFTIKELEAKLNRQKDYEAIKRELSILKGEVASLKAACAMASPNSSGSTLANGEPGEREVAPKRERGKQAFDSLWNKSSTDAKGDLALSSKNHQQSDIANGLLSKLAAAGLPAHLLSSLVPPGSFANVEAFTSILGEELAKERLASTSASLNPLAPTTDAAAKSAVAAAAAAFGFPHFLLNPSSFDGHQSSLVNKDTRCSPASAALAAAGLTAGAHSRPASVDGASSDHMSPPPAPSRLSTGAPATTATATATASLRLSPIPALISEKLTMDATRNASPLPLAPPLAQSPSATSTGSNGTPSNKSTSNINTSSSTPLASSPTASASLEKLQSQLRANVEKFMNENLNTMNISRCVRELLSVHNIGQRLFAKYVLGLSQGTVSELLSKPKPWDKLTEKGRDSYRKMHAWAVDESCIYQLKSLVPRKGKDSTFKSDDPAAEERIQAILSEAQRAMITPRVTPNGMPVISTSGPTNGGPNSQHHNMSSSAVIPPSATLAARVSALNGTLAGKCGNNGGSNSNNHNNDTDDTGSDGGDVTAPTAGSIFRPPSATSPYTAFTQKLLLASAANKPLTPADVPPEVLARIYQEEFAKIIGAQFEDSLMRQSAAAAAASAGGQGAQVSEKSQDDVRQALAIYHQELSRLSHLSTLAAGSGAGSLSPSTGSGGGGQSGAASLLPASLAPGGADFARFAAGLMNGTAAAGYLGHLAPHLIEAAAAAAAASNSGSNSSSGANSSAFSLVRSVKTDSNVTGLPSGSADLHGQASGGSSHALTSASTPSTTNAGDQDPLQRMASITNSLLTQSSTPTVPPAPTRPAKAVLPPITQQQFDQYNNLNTEEIVKNVKDQLSQYSISQRLFGESVLGLSQGSVSDLLARPKPWHMLTQKGREPFIRMKMFLEDGGAVHKLVASQYKIAPEKLMRTTGFVAGSTGPPSSHHHANSNLVAHGSTSHHTSIAKAAAAAAAAAAATISRNPLGFTDLGAKGNDRLSPNVNHTSSGSFGQGDRSTGSTPDLNLTSQTSANSGRNRMQMGLTGSTGSLSSRTSASSYGQSVYEMAALTTDLDTQNITTKIKETLMAHNIGQKIFGEVVLGLSQGSVSELLSKPKPWHMLSIKGREPFIRMQIWLSDPHNIDKLQTLKNERREANKRRRTIGPSSSSGLGGGNNSIDDPLGSAASLAAAAARNLPLTGSSSARDSPLYNFNSNSGGYSPLSGSGGNGNGAGSFSSGGLNNNGSPKKPRILFSDEQKEALKLAFSMDPYPTPNTIEFLASELGLSVRTITNWFHNHRMRLKQVPNNQLNGNSSADDSLVGRETSSSIGATFDTVQFRLALSERLSDPSRRHSSSSSSRNLTSSNRSSLYPMSSHSLHPFSQVNQFGLQMHPLYGNPASCSSPGSSNGGDCDDSAATLDLSMASGVVTSLGALSSSNVNRNRRKPPTGGQRRSLADADSDDHSRDIDSFDEMGPGDDEEDAMDDFDDDDDRDSLPPAPSTTSMRAMSESQPIRTGSSRRKPSIVTSSSSRRKAAQPQWVAPGLDFSGDEEEEDDDIDSDADRENVSTTTGKLINGLSMRNASASEKGVKSFDTGKHNNNNENKELKSRSSDAEWEEDDDDEAMRDDEEEAIKA